MSDQGWIGSMFSAFERLSSRERWLVGGLGGSVSLVLIAVIWMVISGQISELEDRNVELRDALSEINLTKGQYLIEKAKLDANKALLDNNKIKLVREMEKEATRLGITIENFKESKQALTENHRRAKKGNTVKLTDLIQESQEVSINRISLDKLTQLMAALEGRREPVKITSLSIDTLNSDRQVLRRVRMKVSTYRNEEVVP